MSSYPQETFYQTSFSPSSFWAKRRSIVRKNTLHTQLEILKSTGRYEAFRLKWHPAYDDGYKALFWDSDVAKWLEGACYFLAEEKDEKEDKVIDEAVKELTEMIAGAQWKDGYLNIHFTIVKPGLRFTNIRDLHELYNAGHLIEAALIHQQHYKNDLLIDPMLKYVELIHSIFGPGPDQIHGYPGHPEIELALLRLYARTGNMNSYELAKYFITERGNPHGLQGQHFYLGEAKQRNEKWGERPAGDAWPTANAFWYQQAHKPILEQESIEGHSVRAMYLLTAVADLVRIARTVKPNSGHFEAYKTACEKLWDNMVNKKMYLTGGIGSIAQWEGFGIDYFLPQGKEEGGCYAETCASIGIMMMAERMLQLDLDGKYADIMELALYNTVLGGMSQNGKEFLYENHLASCAERPSKREHWFDCACCPPNITRTFGMLGGYLWSSNVKGKDVAINVHLYNSATLSLDVDGTPVTLQQETDWPWKSSVSFTLDTTPSLNVTIRLRIPSWVQASENGSFFDLNPLPTTTIKPVKSYITLLPEYTSTHRGSPITLTFDATSFAPRFLRQHPSTNQNTLTIARGPLIYCAEDVDNDWVQDYFKSVAISANSKPKESILHDKILGDDILTVTIPGIKFGEGKYRAVMKGGFPGFQVEEVTNIQQENLSVVFIPYFYRGNRDGRGHMRVGFKSL
ncbi:hypothetical protein BP6252_01811 [Coleophoma cylindrospora]|uniref:DUF1680-domain-containing protein n=1 Tax=Coleophoma cylindrospora TaxID=1849047 RepID=A0A3D8STZ7_9HELO|nr:hypothetical protein BP6252_01811 [Coleophoma cylindrospora]